MSDTVLLDVVGVYDPSDPNLEQATPEAKALIEKKINNIIAISLFVSFTVMRTIVKCPITCTRYIISYSKV